jgi:hypothetical protein
MDEHVLVLEPVMLSTRHLTAGCFDEVMFFASSEGLLLLVRPGCVLTIVAATTLLWQDPIVYFWKRLLLLFVLSFELHYACLSPLSRCFLIITPPA